MHRKGEVSFFFLAASPVCFPYFPPLVAWPSPDYSTHHTSWTSPIECSIATPQRVNASSAMCGVVLAVPWHLALWRFETPQPGVKRVPARLHAPS